MSGKSETGTCVCCLSILLMFALALVYVYYGSLPFLVGGAIIGPIALWLFYNNYKGKQAKQQLASSNTLNVLDQRIRENKIEAEQHAKGLSKYVDQNGYVRWGTPEQVTDWARSDKAEVQVIIQKEVVKIRCPYCSKLYDEHLSNCPTCGASR